MAVVIPLLAACSHDLTDPEIADVCRSRIQEESPRLDLGSPSSVTDVDDVVTVSFEPVSGDVTSAACDITRDGTVLHVRTAF
jgi:hypothetical protein